MIFTTIRTEFYFCISEYVNVKCGLMDEAVSAGAVDRCSTSCRVFAGLALQIQCYQCEEMTHDCSSPEFIVNCTVNVQDMCQKEVLVKDDGESSIRLHSPSFHPCQ